MKKKATYETELANYNAAVAAQKVITDKVARIEAIMKHMKDTGNNNKGTMADIQAAKEKVDSEINTANTGLAALKSAAEKEHGDLVKKVEDTKKALGEAETTWKDLKGKADQALLDAKTPLEEVGALRIKVTEAHDDLVKKMATKGEQDGKIAD